MKTTGILLYNLANEKGEKIQNLCNQLNIKVRWIQTEEFSKPLESLTNFNATDIKVLNYNDMEEASNTEEKKDKFTSEMFIMVNFSNNLLDKFLKEYKLNQIDPVFLKAILTPHNKTWNSNQLYRELVKERFEMGRLNSKN